eukprot:scaffold31_cov334-Pavlova_lutheri.AAC.73
MERLFRPTVVRHVRVQQHVRGKFRQHHPPFRFRWRTLAQVVPHVRSELLLQQQARACVLPIREREVRVVLVPWFGLEPLHHPSAVLCRGSIVAFQVLSVPGLSIPAFRTGRSGCGQLDLLEQHGVRIDATHVLFQSIHVLGLAQSRGQTVAVPRHQRLRFALAPLPFSLLFSHGWEEPFHGNGSRIATFLPIPSARTSKERTQDDGIARAWTCVSRPTPTRALSLPLPHLVPGTDPSRQEFLLSGTGG